MSINKLFLILIFISPLVYSEEVNFDLGNFNFFLSPKIMKDGSITDFGIGLYYSEKLSGEFRIRYTTISKNEELSGVSDSLNAINENTFELYLLPTKYDFLHNNNSRLWVSGGVYYEYDKLNEKGFFNMPKLELLTPPRERVNSYANDFSMHLLGPLAETGILFDLRFLKTTFSAGVVPIFFMYSSQNMSIIPLLDLNRAKYSQNTWGSPYFFCIFESTIFKYVNIVLQYDYMKLNYKGIDFDANLNWINPEKITITQSIKIEASALIPWGGNLSAQIGYGYTFDSIKMDSAVAISSNKHYIILAVKKSGE